jgi:Double-GTPase 2
VNGSLDYHVAYPLAAILGGAVALGITLFAVALTQGLATAPTLISPRADRAEQVAAHPAGPGEFEPDLGWAGYPYRQARADLHRVRRNVAAGNAAVWRGPARVFFRDAKGWWVVFPVPAVIVFLLSLASLASWCCYLGYALVNTATTAVSRAVLGPAAALLRAAEHARRTRLHTDAACPHCFYVAPWPAFQCPACTRTHHDVSPGRLGVAVRRCVCGARLPTTAYRAAWRVPAACARCGADLPSGAGAVRDSRIPVFGDTSAGKTRFLYASLNSLMATATRAKLDVTFPDDVSREQAEFGLGVIRSRRETAKTSAGGQVSVTIRLGSGRRSELVHLFDAAGEQFRHARRPDTLRFLDDGQGLVYILDPFSVEAVQKQLGGADAQAIRQARAAAGDPELTYHEVASRLRDSGVPASKGRLAIVISKADLLRSAGLTLPGDPAAVEAWLRDLGLHNLVLAARRDFAEVRFFLVASQLVAPGAADDPGAPLRWLLTSHGTRLLGDDSPADPRNKNWRRPAESGPGSGTARHQGRPIPGEHAGAQG